jgi:hypothetical protein
MRIKIIAGLTLLIVLSTCCAAASDGSMAPNSGDVRRGNHWDALLRDGIPLYEDADVVARVAQVHWLLRRPPVRARHRRQSDLAL